MSEEKKQKLKESQKNIEKQKIIDKLVVENRATWEILLSTTTNNIVCIVF